MKKIFWSLFLFSVLLSFSLPTFATEFLQAPVFIITGGPGSGKTSVIEALKKEGFQCFDEIARQIVEEQQGIESEALPYKDANLFNHMVLTRMIDQYKERIPLKTTKPVFLDRGLPDVLGYAYHYGNKLPPYFVNAARKYAFNKVVFILPPWKEIFKNDSARKETFEDAVKIFEALTKAYKEVGYELIELPKTSVEERVRLIKEKTAKWQLVK